MKQESKRKISNEKIANYLRKKGYTKSEDRMSTFIGLRSRASAHFGAFWQDRSLALWCFDW
jgi:hypothetical protein